MQTRTFQLPTFLVATCLAAGVASTSVQSRQNEGGTPSGALQFTPLPASAECVPGGLGETPLLPPPGYAQTVIAREGAGRRRR